MPACYLSKDEFEIERTSVELEAWSKAKSDQIYFSSGGVQDFRLQKGLIKELIEEVFPLVVFAKHQYGDSPQVLFKSVIGNQHYDAIILDRRDGSTSEMFIEITQAHEGEDNYWRRKELLDKGIVFSHSPAIKDGHGNKLKVKIPPVAMDVGEIFNSEIERILEAITRKADKEYPTNTYLLICFDDTIAAFREQIYLQKLDQSVIGKVQQLGLKFEALYLIGHADWIFREYPISTLVS